jgi:DNA (cytosine-5)-methyltransferase 3A
MKQLRYVLSLFDGMSCLQIALQEMHIGYRRYIASEVDKHAIGQTQYMFPQTEQVGDVVFLRQAMTWKDSVYNRAMSSAYLSRATKERMTYLRTINWGMVDLIGAGSPCQGFSFAGKQLAFNDPRSKLFFEFVRILQYIRTKNPEVKYLLENVNMKKTHMRVINEYMGIVPVNINSALVSAQNRDRWYWTNIRTRRNGLFGELVTDIPQPKDRGIVLRDIIEENVAEKYYLSEKMMNWLDKHDNKSKEKGNGFKLNIRKGSDKLGCLSSGQYKQNLSADFIQIDGKAPTQRASTGICMDKDHNYQFIDTGYTCVTMVGRKADENGVRKDNDPNLKAVQRLEANSDGKTNCLTSVQKDNLVMQSNIRIRRLTPTECARLQTIPAWYEWKCSDTQVYRMCGNGWTVAVIMHILSYL